MVEKSNWVAWVAVLALVLAVVSLVVVLNGSVTGNAIFARSFNSSTGNYLLVPLTEAATTGPFPFKNNMYSMSIDFIGQRTSGWCVKLNVQKNFDNTLTPMICEGQTYTFDNTLKLSIEYITAGKALIRMQ